MKKTVIAALVIFGFMFASFARADVFPVEGQPGMFRMSGVVDKYEAYDAKKADGKIGRLYAYPHNKAGEKDKIKKFYITDKTKVTKKRRRRGSDRGSYQRHDHADHLSPRRQEEGRQADRHGSRNSVNFR
ncbi:MAG: hypothetical protein M5R36_30005 [Deltaproteobacteria bacterium]|nr:hypothetical protein [Deltaproteobacteria bacterium]